MVCGIGSNVSINFPKIKVLQIKPPVAVDSVDPNIVSDSFKQFVPLLSQLVSLQIG